MFVSLYGKKTSRHFAFVCVLLSLLLLLWRCVLIRVHHLTLRVSFLRPKKKMFFPRSDEKKKTCVRICKRLILIIYDFSSFHCFAWRRFLKKKKKNPQKAPKWIINNQRPLYITARLNKKIIKKKSIDVFESGSLQRQLVLFPLVVFFFFQRWQQHGGRVRALVQTTLRWDLHRQLQSL